jgi:hypothetical protein
MHTNLVPVAADGSEGCHNHPACRHWIWNYGWPRCEACPSVPSNGNHIEDCDRRIDVPPPAFLAECQTRFAMSLAYAALHSRPDAHRLGNFVERVIDQSDVVVIDHDGIAFDFSRMDIAEMFSDVSWNDRFVRAKLTCVWDYEHPIIAARIKLLWIALALVDPPAAHDVLM